MKKEIRYVNEEKGILQVTCPDERWYIRPIKNQKTGIPMYEYVPSVTWICDHYPKGVSFYKWLASKGWSEAESIKSAAGDRGSKVHLGVSDLIAGKEIAIDSKYVNPSTGKEEELTLEEYECLMSFVSWCKEHSPKFLQNEFTVWGDGYAGTVDLLCEIDGKTYIVDFKTSQYIWPSMELQLSAYKKALGKDDVSLAILQLGYRMNKKRHKFTELDDQYNEFLAAKTIWAKEQKGVEVPQREYPLKLALDQGDKNETGKK